jgi:MinD superfamily P-loop ATPase
VKELVVISGKGGTGKTSIVASFAALAKNKVMADCDVDAFAAANRRLSMLRVARSVASVGKCAATRLSPKIMWWIR